MTYSPAAASNGPCAICGCPLWLADSDISECRSAHQTCIDELLSAQDAQLETYEPTEVVLDLDAELTIDLKTFAIGEYLRWLVAMERDHADADIDLDEVA